MFLQLIIAHLIITFLLALFIYKNSIVYYKPCKLIDKNNNVVDIHKVFEPFHAHDELSFWKLWIGGFFNFPIKFIVSLFIATSMTIHLTIIDKLYPDSDTNPSQFKKMRFGITFWANFFLFANGIRVIRKKVEYEEVYKKYLGQDYDFKDDKYSLLISNHIGFFDVVVLMAKYSAGFMAKKEVAGNQINREAAPYAKNSNFYFYIYKNFWRGGGGKTLICMVLFCRTYCNCNALFIY